MPANRPQPGSAQLGKARTPKHGLVELPEFKQEAAELFAEADYREMLAQISTKLLKILTAILSAYVAYCFPEVRSIEVKSVVRLWARHTEENAW